MIKSIGHLWKIDDVVWGGPGKLGKLLGVPWNQKKHKGIDFRDQIAIYVLYADFDLVYVGQTGVGEGQRLLHRLKQHRDGYMKGRWNRFSWFGLLPVKGNKLSDGKPKLRSSLAVALNHLEAILVDTVEPPLNRQGGRFGNRVTWYRQIRDERLSPDLEKMVFDLWKRREGG